MSTSQDSPQHRTIKTKKVASVQQPPLTNPGSSGPTTFFLRSERDVDAAAQPPRGRKASRDSDELQDDHIDKTPVGSSMMSDISYGVQSLDDTINSTFSNFENTDPSTSLSRINSNTSDPSADVGAEASTLPGNTRKRRAGNPVHPRIAAAGQRIISSDQSSPGAAAFRSGSPVSLNSTDSPVRSRSQHLRRGSAASSVNLQSQPLTPLKMSPRPNSAMPSTPRSGSPKSFRLSDEEVSLEGDSNSQAVESENGEEEEVTGPQGMPQLVMPHIAMPSRRPFTEKGQKIGRLKIMVVGGRGVGKTSLIQSLCRVCEDVVHVDSMSASPAARAQAVAEQTPGACTTTVVEIGASTRPYPTWWTDFESRRQLLKLKNMGDGVLERNITFVDLTGFNEGDHPEQILQYFKSSLTRMGKMEKMHDSDLVGMLSGEGGVQVDLVLYVFGPENFQDLKEDDGMRVGSTEEEVIKYLCRWTNVIPVLGRADEYDEKELAMRKDQMTSLLNSLQVKTFLNDANAARMAEQSDASHGFAISSALADDSETIDASVLMASGYLQPLVSSDLGILASTIFNPTTAAQLRHLSAVKFLLWRQQNLSSQLPFLHAPPSAQLDSPSILPTNADASSICESYEGEEPSKVLVPYGSSSYYRSVSPTASSESSLPPVSSNNAVAATSAYTRALNNASPSEPFRQIRLAKWAQDLQRSLDNERKRYQRLYTDNFTSASTRSNAGDSNTIVDNEKYLLSDVTPDNNLSLTTSTPYVRGQRAAGHLGGPISIIDPRDPLGILAFSQRLRRRSFFALQVTGTCGVIGAVVWFVVRNWADVQEFFGFGIASGYGAGAEVGRVGVLPAPTPVQREGLAGWVAELGQWIGVGRS